MFGIWVIREGKVVPKHLAPPLHRKFADAPSVISDTMDATLCHADGKRYDSKRAYERAVRARGYHILGSKEQPSASPKAEMPDPVPDIKRAIEMTRANHGKKKRKA